MRLAGDSVARPWAVRLEHALFLVFLTILIWAPLPFASNRIWGGALLAALIASIFCVWCVLYLLGQVRIEPGVWRRARWPLALLLLVQGWVWLQMLPLPRPWVEALSPQAFAWHIKLGALTLSLDPEHTRYYLMRGLCVSMGFFLTLALVNTRERMRWLLQILVFSGTLQAVYGVFMVLSGLELGFFVQKYVGTGVATGTFVNRNHLAGYLVMCLAAGIGLLLSQLGHTVAGTWREHARRLLALLLSPTLRLRLYLAIMVVALVLTRSRMGNIAFFTALAVTGALLLWAGHRNGRTFPWKMMAFLGSLFVVDMLILGKWFGFDALAERLENTNPAAESRAWSNQYSLDYLQDFPLTGSGGGSFYGIFPNYQAPDLIGFHQHAHNDYLEFAVELGLPATALLGVFVGLCFWIACKALYTRRSGLRRGAAFACVMTVCWAAVHSVADFNLQIPANALTFMVLLALGVLSGGLNRRAAASGL